MLTLSLTLSRSLIAGGACRGHLQMRATIIPNRLLAEPENPAVIPIAAGILCVQVSALPAEVAIGAAANDRPRSLAHPCKCS